MKKRFVVQLIALTAMLLAVNLTPADAYEILIDVSPSVLNLQSKGTVVTVHTNIDYDLVTVTSVFLNKVPVSFYKSDDRGYFVAKFDMNEIKKLPLAIGEYNTLLLIGKTEEGLTFSGSQNIKVVDVIPNR